MLHVWEDGSGRAWGHRADWLEGAGVFSIDRFRVTAGQLAEAAAAGELVEVELSEPYPFPRPADPVALRRLLDHPSV